MSARTGRSPSAAILRSRDCGPRLSVSGASMNPVRSLAPDLVSGDMKTSWIYIVGPIIGAGIAVGFEWILKGKATEAGTRSAQGDPN